ncbi:MAG: DUF1624 domain-containing protein [Chitinophagaceae bacterium]|nr:MAG: DUF1624 domain-containing protein [Chitinophagaceae bacterium]
MTLSVEKNLTAHRLSSIDALRGLVMIIMALDHSREMFHNAAFTGDPVDMSTTTPALFFTRWITHFCAPVFVFLSGTSIYLQSLRKTKKELSVFLLKRGLWLIVVDLVIMSFGITFDVHFGLIILQVIWAMGISMIILAGAIWLPFAVPATIGLLIVFGHNALDFFEKNASSAPSVFYHLVHRPAMLPISEGHFLGIFYPFVPWTGVLLTGYAFGKSYTSAAGAEPNAKITRYIGFGAIFLFIILRYTNVYGDPLPWSGQKTPVYTFLSFLNTQKYPPSLLYLCMTLGPALVLLSFLNSLPRKLTVVMTVYGKVPFFYYILHFYILHLITAIMFLGRGHSFREGIEGSPSFPFHFIVPGEGLSLLASYGLWILVVACLYPLCRWFGRYKQLHTQWWLSYI